MRAVLSSFLSFFSAVEGWYCSDFTFADYDFKLISTPTFANRFFFNFYDDYLEMIR